MPSVYLQISLNSSDVPNANRKPAQTTITTVSSCLVKSIMFYHPTTLLPGIEPSNWAKQPLICHLCLLEGPLSLLGSPRLASQIKRTIILCLLASRHHSLLWVGIQCPHTLYILLLLHTHHFRRCLQLQQHPQYHQCQQCLRHLRVNMDIQHY